jgi:hypothetical protein
MDDKVAAVDKVLGEP